MCGIIHFAGIVCIIKERDGFMAALPDGRNVKDTRTGQTIEPHYAGLIARPSDIKQASWHNNVFFRPDDTVVFELQSAKLTFDGLYPDGKLDSITFQKNMHRLRVLEPGLNINPTTPENLNVSLDIRQGTLRARRVPKAHALITQVDFQGDDVDTFVMRDGKGGEIIFHDDMEIVIANVSRPRLEGTDEDDGGDNHFFLYHTLGDVSNPKFNLPGQNDKVPEVGSTHPFFARTRGLRVACSNVLYA